MEPPYQLPHTCIDAWSQVTHRLSRQYALIHEARGHKRTYNGFRISIVQLTFVLLLNHVNKFGQVDSHVLPSMLEACVI